MFISRQHLLTHKVNAINQLLTRQLMVEKQNQFERFSELGADLKTDVSNQLRPQDKVMRSTPKVLK